MTYFFVLSLLLVVVIAFCVITIFNHYASIKCFFAREICTRGQIVGHNTHGRSLSAMVLPALIFSNQLVRCICTSSKIGMRRLLVPFFLCAFVVTIQAATIIVTNNNDSGVGSLRQAITDANLTTAFDDIDFNVGTGAITINLLTNLPTISQPVSINGNTQPGYVANTAIFPNPLNGTIVTINLNATVTRSLVVSNTTNFTLRGINLIGNSNLSPALSLGTVNGISVYGCYFGTMADGLTNVPYVQTHQVSISGTSSNVNIGSAAASDRNIFMNMMSANSSDAGVRVIGTISNMKIRGNYFGVAKDGTTTSTTSEGGVNISFCTTTNVTIGGDLVEEGNIMGGLQFGVLLDSAVPTDTIFIKRNFVGTDYTGAVNKAGALTYGINCPATSKVHAYDNLFLSSSAGICYLANSNSSNHQLLRNLFGLDKTGTVPFAASGIAFYTIK
jgi:hypothetical protein